jgi:hypothetical protein
MKFHPKPVLLSLPIALSFDHDDGAAKFAANINTILHGKVKVKYDIPGSLSSKVIAIFYLQRGDDFFALRNEFVEMIEREELENGTVIDVDLKELEN